MAEMIRQDAAFEAVTFPAPVPMWILSSGRLIYKMIPWPALREGMKRFKLQSNLFTNWCSTGGSSHCVAQGI